MAAKKSNFYTMLGLLRSATPEEIRHAYLKAAKKLHPDKNQAPGETELFLDVQQAYQVLLDPQRRAAYDASLSPEEELKVESPLEWKVEISRSAIHSQAEKQLVYALLTVSAGNKHEQGLKKSPPLNICLALDCSTSMQGPKMEMAKASAIQLLQRLGPDDIFSLVRFSDKAEVAIPSARQVDLRRCEMQIKTLKTGGGTEILNALTSAVAEVRRYNNPQYVNHVILLTDGRTYGDEQQCYDLAKIAASQGIGISGMGLGSEWNDIFLDQLANITGASTVFIQQPQDIERFLNEKLTNLSRAFAQNVDFSFKLSAGVSIEYAFRIQPEAGTLSPQAPIRFGQVFYDEPLKVLLEIAVQSASRKRSALDLLTGHLSAAIPSMLMPVPDMPIQITVQVWDDEPTATPPNAILQALSRLTLYRMQDKARRALSNGEYDKATRHLQHLATHLLAQGEKELAKTIMLEAEHIERQKAFTESGEKQIKYGTRSLLMPGERIL